MIKQEELKGYFKPKINENYSTNMKKKQYAF